MAILTLRGLLSLVTWILLATAVLAQQTEDRLPVYKLNLKRLEDWKNFSGAGAKGKVGPKGVGFLVENLSVFQPVNVFLISQEKDKVLRLDIYKYRFEKPERTLTTDREGVAVAMLRTQGDLRVKVSGPEGAGFYLAIIVGDEIDPEPHKVIYTPEEVGGGEKSKGSGVPGWFPVGLLLVIAGVGLVILKRRRG